MSVDCKILYMCVDLNNDEMPLFTGTIHEIAQYANVKEESILSCISRANKKGIRCRYVRIGMIEDEEGYKENDYDEWDEEDEVLNSIDTKETGIKIRSIMDEQGISVIRLAKKLHLTRDAVYRWTQGRALPSLDTARMLTVALKCKHMEDWIVLEKR